jgi:reactive intermediate/imine deaminase
MTVSRREINVPGAGAPVSHYCDAVAANGLLFVSGIIPVDENGQLSGGDDIRAQALAVFERLREVLSVERCTYADIVKITVFLTRIDDRGQINEVRKSFFGDSRPASTLVEISGLVIPGAMLEVEAVAVLPSI